MYPAAALGRFPAQIKTYYGLCHIGKGGEKPDVIGIRRVGGGDRERGIGGDMAAESCGQERRLYRSRDGAVRVGREPSGAGRGRREPRRPAPWVTEDGFAERRRHSGRASRD